MTEEEKKEKKEKRRTADYLWYLHVTGEWVLLLFAACNGFLTRAESGLFVL